MIRFILSLTTGYIFVLRHIDPTSTGDAVMTGKVNLGEKVIFRRT